MSLLEVRSILYGKYFTSSSPQTFLSPSLERPGNVAQACTIVVEVMGGVVGEVCVMYHVHVETVSG